jgi:hypothetical protein
MDGRRSGNTLSAAPVVQEQATPERVRQKPAKATHAADGIKAAKMQEVMTLSPRHNPLEASPPREPLSHAKFSRKIQVAVHQANQEK